MQEYYGRTLGTSKDLVTSACTASGRPQGRLGQLLAGVPEEVLSKFYGCGSPLPLGIEGCALAVLAASFWGEVNSVVHSISSLVLCHLA